MCSQPLYIIINTYSLLPDIHVCVTNNVLLHRHQHTVGCFFFFHTCKDKWKILWYFSSRIHFSSAKFALLNYTAQAFIFRKKKRSLIQITDFIFFPINWFWDCIYSFHYYSVILGLTSIINELLEWGGQNDMRNITPIHQNNQNGGDRDVCSSD